MTASVRCTRTATEPKPALLTGAEMHSQPICPCEMIPSGLPGLCTINGRQYSFEFNATLPEKGEPVVYGFRLVGLDSGNVYDIDAKTFVCDCHDSTYRQRQCKHSQAAVKFRLQRKI